MTTRRHVAAQVLFVTRLNPYDRIRSATAKSRNVGDVQIVDAIRVIARFAIHACYPSSDADGLRSSTLQQRAGHDSSITLVRSLEGFNPQDYEI